MNLILFLLSCALKTNSIPKVNSPYLPLEEAGYIVGDWVETSACSDYLFGFRMANFPRTQFGHLSDDIAVGIRIRDQDSAEALFNAIEESPEITHLIYSRFSIKTTGILFPGTTRPFFGERCSQLRAKTLTVGVGYLGKENAITSNIDSDTTKNHVESAESLNKEDESKKNSILISKTTGHHQLYWKDIEILNSTSLAPTEVNKCLAHVKVDNEGSVKSVSTVGCTYSVKSQEELEAEIRTFKFKPYQYKNEAIPFDVTLPVKYIE